MEVGGRNIGVGVVEMDGRLCWCGAIEGCVEGVVQWKMGGGVVQ